MDAWLAIASKRDVRAYADTPVPDAVELTSCEDATMEGLEGAHVRVVDGTIPSTFLPGSADYTDYETYGQWPISYESCTVYVESGGTAPDFFPVDGVGPLPHQ